MTREPTRSRIQMIIGLVLAAAWPELVLYKGIFRPRSTERPVVSLAVKTHPWLVADAIRWYAEHPEHRAGIGTREEYDRLISTVTADYPRPDVTRPMRPGPVTAAAWVAWPEPVPVSFSRRPTSI